jgi:serine/threonine protein kinase
MDTDRNLLFGVLALQVDLLDSTRFAEACAAWSARKQGALADLLVERGWLTPEERAEVEKLLARKLKKHRGDARASLAEVTTDPVRQSLAAVADPEVQCSLAGLTTPPQGLVLLSTTALAPGARDRYTLSRLHATGGIGRVWLARDASLGRDVALKELHPERVGNPAVQARFLKEAQITGQLEHPGIVPIYEVGQRPEDQAPFYTMRFVRGRTLAGAVADYHARRARGEAGPLELRQLLMDFVGVCNAVAYAHSRGVLHRDLKPQNVVLGDFGEVMVLDWGLARLMDRPDDEAAPLDLPEKGATGATLQGQVLGTPAYMAPEQAEGRLDQLGPATDVYGLGAILYEILTGQPPFSGSDTATVLQRVIHEAPARPRSLHRGMPAPLEAVCLKALAKQAAARYATAKELAAEVQRWLADEPVTAYRDPLLTRARRWAGRNRTLVSAAAVLLVAGVLGLSVGTVLLNRARAETERQRLEAVRAHEKADAVNRFLVQDLLNQANPHNNPVGDKVTVRELLHRAAGAVDKNPEIKANPGLEGSVRSAIGNTYLGLGLYQRSREQLERAVECQDRAADVAASERIFTKNRLCWVVYKLGSFDETMAREVFAEAREQLGRDHEETVYAADTLATISLGNGNRSAFNLYRENLAIQQRVLGPDHLLTIRAACNLADGLMSNQSGDRPGNLMEALSVMLSAREAAGRLGPDHPDRLYFENALGFLCARMGESGQAQEVLAPLEKHYLRVFGADHIDVARYHENLALAEEGLGRLDAAEALLRKAHTTYRKQLGEKHGLRLRATMHLGRVCMARGKTETAVAWLRALIDGGGIKSLEGGPSRPIEQIPTAADINHLGDALSGKADPKTSVALLQLLSRNLEWLAWRSDWLGVYVKSLVYDAACRLNGTSEEQARRTKEALGVTRHAVGVMESNPATPPRILKETRARFKRLVKADTARPPRR